MVAGVRIAVRAVLPGIKGVAVERAALVLEPDPCRVIGRPYVPGDDPSAVGQPRLDRLARRALELRCEVVETELADVRQRFGERHRDLDLMLMRNSERVAHLIDEAGDETSPPRRRLSDPRGRVGAAALTNPSMPTAFPTGALESGRLGQRSARRPRSFLEPGAAAAATAGLAPARSVCSRSTRGSPASSSARRAAK